MRVLRARDLLVHESNLEILQSFRLRFKNLAPTISNYLYGDAITVLVLEFSTAPGINFLKTKQGKNNPKQAIFIALSFSLALALALWSFRFVVRKGLG